MSKAVGLEDKTLVFLLGKGAMVHVNGVPVFLEEDTLARTHCANLPLIIADQALQDEDAQIEEAQECLLRILAKF